MTRQQEVMKYLSSVETASLEEIYNNVSFSYYCNYKKHLGDVLSRMVKSNIVERVKKGVFKVKVKSNCKAVTHGNVNNQLVLL